MKGRNFEVLVRDCHADVYRAALYMCGRPDDAADVAQEIYLDLHAGRIDPGEAASPCALLRWYAVRRALMVRRAAATRKKKEEEAVTIDIDRNSDPARAAAERDDGRLLWTEVMALPDELRRPLLLRYREQLSFARVGEALGLPLQTVHDRVKRALERLRPRLGSAGLSAAALPEVLGSLPGPAVPSGLEASLLGLAKSAALLVAMKAVAVAVVVTVAGLGLARFVAEDDAALASPSERAAATLDSGVRSAGPLRDPGPIGPEPGVAAAVLLIEEEDGPVRASEAARPEVPNTNLGPAEARDQDSTGTLVGRALDQHDRPVPGALVSASSVEHVGTMPRFAESARTGPDGRVELSVPVERGSSRRYRLRLRLEDHDPRSTSPLEVRADAVTDSGDHLLRRRGEGDRPELEVLVLGSDGEALAGARVEMMKLLPRAGQPAWPNPGAAGRTDAAGRILIPGVAEGPYRLRVDGSRQGLGIEYLDVELPVAGRIERCVILAEGRDLRVRARDLEGQSPRGLSLRLRDPRDPNNWISFVAAGDELLARGLGAGPYELWNDDPWWSSFRIAGVEPGTAPLELVVKRREDPRDLGEHAGEIHFRPVDARSGEVVDLDDFAIDTHWVPDLPDSVLRADHMPWLAPWPMVQRAVTEVEDLGLEPVPGSEGMAQVVGLGAGTWVVAIRGRDHAPKLLGPFRVTDREIVVLERVELEPRRRLRGIVVDESGSPVAGALIVPGGSGEHSRAECDRIAAFMAENPNSQRYPVAGAVYSDRAGRFTIEEVPADLPVLLHAIDPRGGRAASEPVGVGENGELRMIMRR